MFNLRSVAKLLIQTHWFLILFFSGNAFAQMTDAEIAALTPPEVAELTMDQLAALTPSQVAALTMAQLAVLTPAQISALLPEQVAGLTLAQLAALTPAQIADLLAVARGARADEDLLPLMGYKPNYFLHTEHRVEPQDRLKRELKFQISAKKALWGEWAWFGYTQKAFWQLYDDDANDGNAYDSGEFRELNFNPEIFFVAGPFADFRIQFSPLDHESNGAGSDTSRSLFRSYVQGIFDRGTYKLSLKLRKYRKLDQNPTLEDFLGKWEANFEGGFGPMRFQLAGWQGEKDNKGTVRADISLRARFIPFLFFPKIDSGVFIHLQYFSGYGESLIDFDRRVNRVGIGVLLR